MGGLCYFNPRAPCGARRIAPLVCNGRCGFQSTRPVWGATLSLLNVFKSLRFQSTRPVWGATQVVFYFFTSPVISIHAPRVGRDEFRGRDDGMDPQFQSTRPVWGATTYDGPTDIMLNTFQSTRPVWGATANLTILPRQICTKGTKEFLLGRKTHGKKEK